MERVLLHGICKRFPGSVVTVSCSCLETHVVSTWGFLLLEEVEAKLESVEQNVLRVVAEGWLMNQTLEEPLLSALSTRVLRQHDMVEELFFGMVVCNNKNSAESWATLVEKSNAFSAPGNYFMVCINEGIGADGWAAIRRIVERLSPAGKRDVCVNSKRKTVAEGRREDIKAIWNRVFLWKVALNSLGS